MHLFGLWCMKVLKNADAFNLQYGLVKFLWEFRRWYIMWLNHDSLSHFPSCQENVEFWWMAKVNINIWSLTVLSMNERPIEVQSFIFKLKWALPTSVMVALLTSYPEHKQTDVSWRQMLKTFGIDQLDFCKAGLLEGTYSDSHPLVSQIQCLKFEWKIHIFLYWKPRFYFLGGFDIVMKITYLTGSPQSACLALPPKKKKKKKGQIFFSFLSMGKIGPLHCSVLICLFLWW